MARAAKHYFMATFYHVEPWSRMILCAEPWTLVEQSTIAGVGEIVDERAGLWRLSGMNKANLRAHLACQVSQTASPHPLIIVFLSCRLSPVACRPEASLGKCGTKNWPSISSRRMAIEVTSWFLSTAWQWAIWCCWLRGQTLSCIALVVKCVQRKSDCLLTVIVLIESRLYLEATGSCTTRVIGNFGRLEEN